MEFKEDSALVNDKQNGKEPPPSSDLSSKSNNARLVGYSAMIAGGVIEAVSLSCAQSLGGYVPPFQLNLWRFWIHFVVFVFLVIWQKIDIRIPRGKIPFLAVSCLAWNFANMGFFGASIYLPAGTVSCVSATLILGLVTVVNMVLDKQCVPRQIILAIILVSIGVILSTQPDFLFGNGDFVAQPVCPEVSIIAVNRSQLSVIFAVNTTNETFLSSDMSPIPPYNETQNQFAQTNTAPITISNPYMGYMYVCMAAVCLATLAIVMSRTLREISLFVILLYVGGSGVVVSLTGMGIFETPMFPAGFVCISLLLGHGLCTSIVSVLYAVGIMNIPTEFYALLRNITLVVLFVEQYTVLRHVNPGHRNAMEVAGALLILGGNCLDPVYKIISLKVARQNGHEVNTDE